MPGPRIVFLDIELAPIVSAHWGTRDQNFTPEQIIEDWTILGASWKVYGQKRVHWLSTEGRGPRRTRDDRRLCKDLWPVLHAADWIGGQNVKNFDLQKIDARMVQHGMKPYSPVRTLDTLLESRKRFGFTFHGLKWTSQILTNAPKLDNDGWPLWFGCLDDKPAAWRQMRRYCCRDTVAAEKKWRRILPWINNAPNVATHTENEELRCPKCNSAKLQCRGRQVTQLGVYHRYQCQRCGGWSRGRKTLNKWTSEHLLAN